MGVCGGIMRCHRTCRFRTDRFRCMSVIRLRLTVQQGFVRVGIRLVCRNRVIGGSGLIRSD